MALKTVTMNERPELIETMRADPEGKIALIHRHLLRLQTSAQSLHYQWPGNSCMEDAIALALAARTVPTGQTRVRLLLSPSGGIHVETAPLAAMQARPFVALTTLTLRSEEPWLQHKATHRPWYQPTTQWLALHPEFFDLIFLNERDELCEGSRSNLYIKQGQRWLTPPLRCGLLGGVVRQHLLDTGEAVEAVLTREDFDQPGAELRLSNGLRDWFDVQRTTQDKHLDFQIP